MEVIKKYLDQALSIQSITGRETEFSEFLIDIIKDKVDSYEVDALGNLKAFIRGNGSEKLKILYDAHMDQIGLLVTHIEKNGIVRFTNIGGINPLVLYGKKVKVYGNKEMIGVIGMTPPHISNSDSSKALGYDKLFIDLGFSSNKEAEKFLKVGDTALLDSKTIKLKKNNYSGIAFDDKAGVLALLSLIEQFSKTTPYHDIYIVFSTQEEIGLRGAKVAGYDIYPDIAIACDVTFADPVGVPYNLKTGEGPVLTIGPGHNSKLYKILTKIADDEDIPFQKEVEPRPGGTNTFTYQISKGGVFSMLISIPLRYMHTQVEIVNIKDIYRTSKLMKQIGLKEELDLVEVIK